MQSRKGQIIYKVLPVISVCLLITVWVLFSSKLSTVMASPEMVFQRLVKFIDRPVSGHQLTGHILASLSRIFVGLLSGMVIGIILGLVIGLTRIGKATIGILFEIFRSIPPLAWIPLFIVILGTGETSKYVMVFIGAVVPITINTYTGVSLVDPEVINVGIVFHASKFQIIQHIVFPSCLPSIFTGLTSSVGVCFMVVLAAEMMGADTGLGLLITRGMAGGDIALIFIGMILIGVLGALFSVLVKKLERWFCRWNEFLN